MKVIFLDVDGVLNSDSYFERTKNEKNTRDELDENNILVLKSIIDETNALVVVTSTWKELKIYSLLKETLSKYNISIYDKTIHLNYQRGNEIRQYLSTHNIDNFIIIDDEVFPDFNNLTEYLIKTDFYNGGLTNIHKEKSIKLLNKTR